MCGQKFLPILIEPACSFTQSLTQNLSQSIWSIQLDDLLNYGRWEDSSISRLSCVTQFMINLTNMISRTFLGSLVWHKYDKYDISNISISRSVSVMWRVDSFSYFLQKYNSFKLFIKKNVYTVWLMSCRINWAAIPPCGHTN